MLRELLRTSLTLSDASIPPEKLPDCSLSLSKCGFSYSTLYSSTSSYEHCLLYGYGSRNAPFHICQANFRVKNIENVMIEFLTNILQQETFFCCISDHNPRQPNDKPFFHFVGSNSEPNPWHQDHYFHRGIKYIQIKVIQHANTDEWVDKTPNLTNSGN